MGSSKKAHADQSSSYIYTTNSVRVQGPMKLTERCPVASWGDSRRMLGMCGCKKMETAALMLAPQGTAPSPKAVEGLNWLSKP